MCPSRWDRPLETAGGRAMVSDLSHPVITTSAVNRRRQARGAGTEALMTYTCFKLDALTPSLWRTTFNNPPINLIDVRMVAELRELFVRIERNEGPAVLIFESADPDYFLAHFDISPANLAELASLPPGPTGLHPWLDILVRLSMLPAVTISAIRGRARGARVRSCQ
jgi:enoyl-CoA hydratase/carnithine racemase